MKVALMAALLTTLVFAGCISTSDSTVGEAEKPDLKYDPTDIRVNGVEVNELEITSFDGTNIATLIYAPLTSDSLPDGSEPPFPVVFFLHGWGFPKESWQFQQDGFTSEPFDILDTYAQQGFIVVAYDARGWGRSGGQSSAGFTNEMKDFDAVLDYVNDNFKTNGLVGVTGVSYGGGQAMRLWAENDNVTTAVPHNGWMDLYEGVAPGNTPKLEWFEFLYALGVAGTGGQLTPEIHDWYQKAALREGSDDIRAAMDLRSVGDAVKNVTKPLFTCQGMEETLFPQAHDAWENSPGFTRAYYYTGGHNVRDGVCYERTLDWFLYFLQGKDNGVDQWPPLISVDVAGGEPFEFKTRPEVELKTLHLRAPDFTEFNSNATFTISQRVLANPLEEPSMIWDTTALPRNAIPEQLRQDPAGVTFTSAPILETQTLLGAPTVTLRGATSSGFQVVGTLYHISEGASRVLGYGAYTAENEGHLENVELEFPWIKADMSPGDQYQLKLASNQPEIFAPLLSNYEVTFNGHSMITIPFIV